MSFLVCSKVTSIDISCFIFGGGDVIQPRFDMGNWKELLAKSDIFVYVLAALLYQTSIKLTTDKELFPVCICKNVWFQEM